MPTSRMLTTVGNSSPAPRVLASSASAPRLLSVVIASAALLFLLLAVPSAYGRKNGEEVSGGTVADTTKCVTAVRINGAGTPAGNSILSGGPGPRIDGVLDEPFWKNVPRSGNFTQYQPDEGKPASESTFVKVAYDDEAIYVGLEMYDSEPDKIVDRLTRRDRMLEADIVHVMVDSHHDHLTAYCFSLYSSGTQRDAYYYNDTNSDETWDAVWQSATKKTAWGWTAEMRIPFSCLRFSADDMRDPAAGTAVAWAGATGADGPVDPPERGTPSSVAQANGHKWGIYFSRNIARKGELDRWNHIPDSAGGFVSKFGHVAGIYNIKAPKRLEILPYAVSYGQTELAGPGNPDGRDYMHNAGFDAKYGLTSDITLNATINPDFGQVEADETVLNLSTFETWYPEKRPFFVEGNEIFATNFSLFYSRRIGRPPSLSPVDLGYYEERPAATTILGAAKVSGKTGGGTSIGIMEAVTQREKATYVSADGFRKKAVIEPEANYLVARVRQDILRNSTVGILATAVNQKDTNPDYTGGADWDLRFHDGDYQVNGQAVASRNWREKNGWGSFLGVQKSGGQNFRGSLSGQYLSRDLDLNRVGYLQRDNYQEYWGWLQYRTNKKWWIIRKTWNNLNLGYADNTDGVALTRGGNFNNNIQLANMWEIGGGVWLDYAVQYSDWETRGGPPSPIPFGQSWWFNLNTDPSKWLVLSSYLGGGDTSDGHFRECNLGITLQPRSNIEFAAEPGYRYNWAVSRWLANVPDAEGNRRDIFGEQKLHQLDLTMRGTVTFTRDLTLQVYAQPFFAAVHYSNFKKLVPPRSYEYVDSSVYDAATQRPDFNWASFNSNVIMRWEYRPGSALFLVWTQARETFENTGDFRFGRDWNGLYDTTPGNTFLVKVSYWWSM